ncbi:ABC transporter substrate-binding protein [Actinosynnema sp. NPDC047251]|uniref:ABC-type transporter, substrate-binding lipoprotein, family 5 n=1 Tax=Saccharothrix espanaensis (strain ATCC 51144 / DSM 44229 / JCM 9112 / NBRC 15066 / NRRL 15764) TaxID=1179773 RepID=K0K2I0_SACES|nr:ABC transporter substrate-binding protein [Saccharothrix espanaensis]CCH31059.1 ABC-type transporter, substrate-binding lipoprotein, family 5 [Saccharothrix espanaensis DSM 44229]
MRRLARIPAARIAASVIAVSLFAGACGTGGAVDPGAVTANQEATPPDDRLDLDAAVDVRLVLEPTGLDLFSTAGAALDQVLLDNVYEGLLSVDTDDNDKIVPRLASSHEVSPDGLTYTFHLVPGAKFHDGTPLTSADVAWSLEQQFAPGSKAVYAADFASIASVAAPDPATVVVTLKQRDTFLLWNLTQRGGAVYRKGTDSASLAGTANGSGPFTLTRWNRGASITLSRNGDYWGARPKVAKVVFHYIPEPNAANNAQQTGETDVQTAADPTLLQPFTGDGYTILRGTTTDKFTLAFNGTRAPFDNPDVRRAIRQAIDKQDVIKAVGAGTAIGSAVPPQDPWYEDLTAIDAHNPDNARKLLAGAGFPNGLELTLTVPSFYPRAIGDVLVSNLKDVGVTLAVKQVEFQTWLSQVHRDKEFQLSLVDHAEARDLVNYTKPDYYFGYDDEQVRQWYAQARTASGDGERDGLLKRVARKISEDAATDWLFLDQTHTVVRKGVYGVPKAETSNRYDLASLAVAK